MRMLLLDFVAGDGAAAADDLANTEPRIAFTQEEEAGAHLFQP